MKRKNAFFVWHIWGIFMIFTLGNVSTSAILVSTDTVPVRHLLFEGYNFPARTSFSRYNSHLLRGEYVPLHDAFPLPKKHVFRIGPSDALVDSKWSQPVAENHQLAFHTDHNMGRPATIPFNRDRSAAIPFNSDISAHFSIPEKKIQKNSDQSDPNILKGTTVSNIGKESVSNIGKDSVFSKLTPASDYLNNDSLWLDPKDINDELGKKEFSFSGEESHLSRNNFTDSNDSQIYVPSNSVLKYQPSSDAARNSKLKFEDMPQSDSSHDMTGIESTQRTSNTFTFYATDSLPSDRDALQKENAITRIYFETPASPKSTGSKVLEYFTSTEGFVTDTPTTLNYSTKKTNNSEENMGNLPTADSTVSFKLSSGAVTGIVISVLVCVTLITSAVIYLLYRRYSGKCTSVVDGKYNSDNCGYLDDSLRSSVYLNNHIELPKENSEEMTSLDNDSFLNSLETMTIQNYWADNTKNTKV